MNDRSSEQTNYSELKFSRQPGFFNDNLKLRWLIALLFAIALFATLHFRETPIELPEVDSIAPRYVVAQVNFEFYDNEATIILKQEALRDIGKIYTLDESEIRQRRLEYETALSAQQEWRQHATATTFDEMYRAGELVEKALLTTHFTDPRTLRKMEDLHLPVAGYQIFTPPTLKEAVPLPPHIWENIRNAAFEDPSVNSEEAANFIISWFEVKNWQLIEDIPSQTLLSKRLRSLVPDKYTAVAAGSRIIDQGDRVSPRHLAMLQAMQRELQEKRNLWHPLTLIGSAIMTVLLTSICAFYFKLNHPKVTSSNRALLLLVTIIILTFALAKGTEFLLLTAFNNLLEIVRYPIIVPFTAILLCNLMNPAIATFVSGLLTIVLAISFSFEKQGFLFINLVTSFVAILSSRSLKQRTEFFAVCGKTWLASVAALIALGFYQSSQWYLSIPSDIGTATVNMLLIGVLVVGILPLLEGSFRVMTDVSLMEYMNPNSDLLRRLSIEAPGTYQHSIIVGNLSEACALAIGANGLFCRAATLYHDIGKIVGPRYFTENQNGADNPHQLLTPKESTQVILSHVTEGVAMARKVALPEQFIDIIREHHGTTLIYYFYRKELERLHGNRELIDEGDFRYPGPKPRSKESAVIMIADSFEAASRSLSSISQESLELLAQRLIKEKGDDGQFDNCLLTCEELTIVKATLVKTLLAFSHSRVKYPNRESTPEEPLSLNFEERHGN